MEEYLEFAKYAEKTERYDDMAEYMKKYVSHAIEKSLALTSEERNLLSVAYKNVVGARRSAWRILKSIETKQGLSDQTEENADKNQNHSKIMEEYKQKVTNELRDTCNELLGKLDSLGNTDDKSSQVFYLKMKGDYYRYLAEVSSPSEKGVYSEHSLKGYKEAYDIAVNEMEPTHPIRLGLALNFSVFHYEICENKKEACELAKKAFDDAIAKLDTLEEESYKDSTLIMQLLRDNLTLWSAEDETDKDDADN